MRPIISRLLVMTVSYATLATVWLSPSFAALRINEILFNPPGSGADSRFEYIELRGTPNNNISSSVYLLCIEGDASGDNSPGKVQNRFNLGTMTVGPNGLVVLLQKNHTFTTDSSANTYTNSGTGAGWGSGSGSSTIIHVGENGQTQIENASVTFMLVIAEDSTPVMGDDIDSNNDGVPDGSIYANWTVLDSVGVLNGDTSATNRVYGKINFKNTDGYGWATNTSTIVNVGFTPAYIARTGNTTNWAATDWIAADVTGTGPNFSLDTDKVKPSGFGGKLLSHIGAPNFGVHNENNALVLLNEAKVNPPDEDSAGEFVELRGAVNTPLTGLYLVALDGEGSGKGKPDVVVNLNPHSLGSKGLAIVLGSGHPYTVPTDTTVIVSNDFNTTGGILRNGTFSLLLVNSPLLITSNTDFDASDDGVIDLPAGANLFDAIGWSDGGSNDFVYGGANVTGLSFVPDAATRFKANSTPLSTTAWFYGELRGQTNSIFYETSQVSGNFPAGGILTPGRTNDVNNEPVITSSLSDLSRVLSDPSSLPVTFTFSDVETATGSLGLSVTSGNPSALPQNRITVTGTGGSRTITIAPTNVCFDVPIIITISDGVNSPSNVIRYAVSLGWKTNAIFPIGMGDASAALAIDAGYMLVADDETYPIRLFSRTNSGLAIKEFDFTASLGTTNTESDGELSEVDIEGCSRTGDRIYWMGSFGNTTDGLFAPNRNRLFATTITGEGTNVTLSYVGRYDHIRDDLLAWDKQGLHDKGADYYGLQSSAGLLSRPKTPSGLTAEGFTLLNGTTNAAYIAFRSPFIPISERRKALLVLITNLSELVNGNPSAGPAKFGEPVELDLGGRGVRSIERNGTGYLIVAGPCENTTGDPFEFRLFTWSGNPFEQPQMRSARLEGMSPEAIVDVPAGPFHDSMEIQLLSDNGFKSWYLPVTDVITKDLIVTNFKKFQADRVSLGSILPLYSPALVQTNLRSGRFVRGSGLDQSFHSFVSPLDQARGLALDAIAGNALSFYPSNDWTNSLSHYNATNPASPLVFQNPLAAFGSVARASPLYINTTYSFKVGFGDRPQKTTETSPSAFCIWAYERASFRKVGEILVFMPVDPWAAFPEFGRKGLAHDDAKFGLRTVIQLSTEGPGTNVTWHITHQARKSEYVFVVGGLGFYGDPSAGGSSPRSTLVTSSAQASWSPLYVINFDSQPPWKSRFIGQPHFTGEPIPPAYAGKSVQELLTYSTLVTNVVSLPQAPSTYTNLDHSPELRAHPTLDRFVNDMGGDPLALATYVQNEIELTDAFAYNDAGSISESSVNLGGVNRGALGVFLEGQGSPVEQCALLIYFLRKAGVPAVYIYPERNGLKLLDTRLSNLLRVQLKHAVNDKGQTNLPELVPVNYPWVAAYVSSNWVHLFPWLKDTEIIEGLNLYDYMPTNCNSGTKWVQDFLHLRANVMHLSRQGETIMDIFPRFVRSSLLQEHPGISIDDLGVSIRNRNHAYATFQDFPTPTLLTNLSYAVESLAVITNTLPAMTNIFDLMSVHVYSAANPSKQIASGDFQTADLHNRQFTLWYQETNGNHNMILTLESFRPSTTNRITFGTFNALAPDDTNVVHTITSSNLLNASDDAVIIRMTHKRHRTIAESFSTNPPPHFDAFLGHSLLQPFSRSLQVSQERTVRKGDLINICLNVGQVSRNMIFEQQERYWPHKELVRTNGASANSISPEFYRGKFNYIMGMTWFERVNRFRKLSQRLHKTQTVSWFSVALAQLGAKRNSNGDLLAGFLDLRRPRLDVCYQQIGIAANGTIHSDNEHDLVQANDDFLEILMAEASVQEHTVINDFYKVKAISTIGVLHKSQQTGLASEVGILKLNRTNYQTYGETYYGSGTYNQKLKDFDPSIWETITNVFVTPGMSNYAKVFMSPGLITNDVGKHISALIFSRNYYAALLSTNINGGEGEESDGESEQSEIADTAGPEGDSAGNVGLYMDKAGGVKSPEELGHNLDGGNHAMVDFPHSGELQLPAMLKIIDDIRNGALFMDVYAELEAALRSHPMLWFHLTQNLGIPPESTVASAITAIHQRGNEGTDSYHYAPNSVGDPVDVIRGNFYINEVDLVIAGTWPLELRRNYSSNNKGRGALGYGWRLAHVPYLIVSATSNAISAAEPDGSLIKYTKDLYGVWRPSTAGNRSLVNPNQPGQPVSANLFEASMVETQDSTGTHLILQGPDGSKRTFTWMAFPNALSSRERPYLEKWEDHRGNFYRFKYVTSAARHDYGQLRRIESCSGPTLTFEYSTSEHVTRVSSSDGRHVRYFYDASDDLVRVVLSDGSERHYEYSYSFLTNVNLRAVEGWIQFTNFQGHLDLYRGIVGTNSITNIISNHLLIKEIKPDGRVLRNEYDKEERVINQWAPVGLDLRLVLNATFVYSNNYAFTNASSNGVSGYTLVLDAFGNTNRYEYTNGLMTKVVDPLGNTVTTDWYHTNDSFGGYRRSVKRRTDKRGLTTFFVYDSNGNVVTNSVSGTDLTGDGATNALYSFTYAPNNRLTALISPLGNQIKLYYASNYPGLPECVVSVSPPPFNFIIATNYFEYLDITNIVWSRTNTSFGLMSRAVQAVGTSDAATNDFAYDARGFPTQHVQYSGTSDPNVVRTFMYNARGELAASIDAAGRTTRIHYDASGRQQMHEVYEADSSIPLRWEQIFYNLNGEVSWTDGPRFDPEDYAWNDYDGAGRRTAAIRWRTQAKLDGSGVEPILGDEGFAVTRQEHDIFGNLKRVTDPRGVITAYDYDALGRQVLVRVFETNGTLLKTEHFAHEPGGQVTLYTNGLGGVTETQYTSIGKPKYRRNLDGSTNAMRYDLNGRVKKEIQRNGSYWETVYDDAVRRVTRTFKGPDGSALFNTVSQMDRRGNVIWVLDSSGFAITNAYDCLNRMKWSAGPIVSYTHPPGAPVIPGGPPPSVQQTSTNFYDAAGIVTTNINALGEKTITYLDAAGRPTRMELRDSTNVLLREATTGYAANHNGVTVTNGSSWSAIASTTYTDNDGNTLLSIGYPDPSAKQFTRRNFDVVANLVSEITVSVTNGTEVEWTTENFTYDGLGRLCRKVAGDGATTLFGYDQLGNLTNRLMPGGLQFVAEYNAAGQKLRDYFLGGGGIGARTNLYTYFTSGPFIGLVESRSDGRGVVFTYVYDDWLRPTFLIHDGPLNEQDMVTYFEYDQRGLPTLIEEQFADSGTGPSTTINRAYDAYGRLTNENVFIESSLLYQVAQSWNATGQRQSIGFGNGVFGFNHFWRPDGSLGSVQATGGECNYFYDTAGQLDVREVGARATYVTQRDGIGRPMGILTLLDSQIAMEEALTWTGDGLVAAHMQSRLDYTNYAQFFFAHQTRRLIEERTYLDGTRRYTNVFAFDGGQAQGPGLLTQIQQAGHAGPLWTGGTDGLLRVAYETNNLVQLVAYGNVNGLATVSAFLDEASVPVVATVAANGGPWRAHLDLTPGIHQLRAEARHPSGSYAASSNHWFTNNVGSLTVTDNYDGAGNLTQKIWRKADGSTNRSLAFSWDARGRLVRVIERDSTESGRNWSGSYDAMSRLLRTSDTPVTNGVTNGNSTMTIKHYYDSQYEFLEVGVSENGLATWKVMGPDIDGRYGSQNGTGGLEAIVPGSGLLSPIISDFRGNLHGRYDSAQSALIWYSARMGAYGGLPGHRPFPLGEAAADLGAKNAWRNRWRTTFGTYMGANWLLSDSLQFAAFDEQGLILGQGSGYSVGNGNPSDWWDPTGRAAYLFDGTWNHELQTDNGVSAPTNVRKFGDTYASGDVFYYRGVGNSLEHGKLARAFQGATGAGSKAIREQAYQQLVQNYNAGDTVIDIVGFSRGAANAMQFTHTIYGRGIPDLNSARAVTHTHGKYTLTRTVYDKYLLPPKSSGSIRFAGFFDTVHAMGMPGLQVNIGYKTHDIAPNVLRAFHAVALNERRAPFAQTDIPSAYTTGFPGVHSNIGGGYADSELSDLTLGWMMRVATESGVQFNPISLNPNPNGSLGDPSAWYYRERNRQFPPNMQPYDAGNGDSVLSNKKFL